LNIIGIFIIFTKAIFTALNCTRGL